ncbi:hypothetical protein RDV64_18770 [Acuticoccus sp. MNP-M23]|uniref:hypothetical protein n=1 Tax=Acuticoccus sp. MNP-M23 TaxID=3072793 RepID=UPI002815175D|nr:hypothetical protein [Acuticoccus sp. MNP-M23]WMS42090.1 hypothetical protein RDV64_18770 [Acuticoccus sp. MNP-M23]
MSYFSRITLAAAVFTGSVAAAAFAANNERFYETVTTSVGDVAGNFVIAGGMLSGDRHLEYPAYEESGDKMYDDRISASSVVTHVEVVGGTGRQRIVLLNPQGQEVFTHDPENNTTIVAKDVMIPSITFRDAPDAMAELRLVTAAPKIEAPAALREQLVAGVTEQPELFYREDL